MRTRRAPCRKMSHTVASLVGSSAIRNSNLPKIIWFLWNTSRSRPWLGQLYGRSVWQEGNRSMPSPKLKSSIRILTLKRNLLDFTQYNLVVSSITMTRRGEAVRADSSDVGRLWPPPDLFRRRTKANILRMHDPRLKPFYVLWGAATPKTPSKGPPLNQFCFNRFESSRT